MKYFKFFRILIIILLIVFLLGMSLLIFFKYSLISHEYKISNKLGIKAVVISDMHVNESKCSDWMSFVVKKVNNESPDIVFLLGDFLFSTNSNISCLDSLQGIKSRLGVFAILGNHDFYNSKELKNKLNEFGITFLIDEKIVLKLDNDLYIDVVGINDLWRSKDYNKDYNLTSDYHILLSHNPKIIYDTNFVNKYDLILSGHTHGGQVIIPFYGPVYWFHDLGNEYIKGYFPDKHLIISNGVGESVIQLRFWVFPSYEVVYL